MQNTLFSQTYNMDNNPVSTCLGTFYDSGGSSGSYLINESYTKTFTSDNGNRISFNFQSFSTESGYDKLYIYDGPSTLYPLLGIYSGASSPGIIESTGTSLTFYFYSDGSTNSSGWSANISCTTPALPLYTLSNDTSTTCSGIFSDNGGLNNNYPNNQNDIKTFISDNGQFIVFNFTHFNVANDDTLYVYDGTSVSSPIIGLYTGTDLPENIFSRTGNSLTFKFISNSVNNSSGWRALISCSPTTPQPIYTMQTGIRYTCSGIFTDDGGASYSYSNNRSNYMTFISDNGNRISFDFQQFSTESGYDKMYIYDGLNSSYPLLGIYSGTSSPGIITSTGTSLTFYFYSDASNVSSGWSANINCSTPVLPYFNMSSGTDSVCSGLFFDNGGPSQNYPDNENRVHTLCSNNGEYITFNFTHFSLSSDDTLFVYDGNSISSPIMGVYYGTSLPEMIYSKSGNCVTFKFISNNINTSNGWRALINCSSVAPVQNFNIQNGKRYTCSGNFYDDGGSTSGYSNNQSRIMTFYSDNGNRINFNFLGFTTESGYDKLYVYDGSSTSYPIIGTYSGISSPGSVTSTGTSLTFYFYSDGSNINTGWNANISCTTPPLPVYNLTSGTINTCTGVFYDNGGASINYPHNENRVQTFCSDSGNFIKFSFTANNFSIVDGDSLFVYDGITMSNPLAIFTGYSSPGSINSVTGSCLTFKFVSNATSNSSGWQALISCIDTINTVTTMNMGSGAMYTCNGKFYDSGDSTGSYANSENKTMTIFSNSGCPVSVTFTSFSTESSYDKLYVYDGPSLASPLIGTYSGITIPPSTTSTGNCLTFRFTSDASNINSGWIADITCEKAGITTTPSSSACLGDTITLTATPGTSYLWNNGQTTQSIIVMSSGIYSVSVTSVVGCNLVSDPKIITINSRPASTVSISGSTTFCQGNSVLLTASTGTLYNWNTSSTTSSVNVTSSGNYWVTVTNASGCSTISDTVSVIVNPLPVLNIPVSSNLCNGDTIYIDAGAGFTSYLWNTSATTQQIAVTQAGNYSVTVTNEFSCQNTDVTSINLIQNPVADYTYTVNNGTVNFTNTSSNSNTYYWLFDDGTNSSLSSPSHIYTQSGLYNVILISTNECGSDTATYQINVIVSDLNSLSIAKNIKIFPNPNSGKFTISILNNVSKNIKINITDILNREVYATSIKNSQSNVNLEIDISKYGSGFYNLIIKDSTEEKTFKIAVN